MKKIKEEEFEVIKFEKYFKKEEKILFVFLVLGKVVGEIYVDFI